MTAALQFDPMFIYGALGLVGILVVARTVLGWAVGFS
jgi:hypothetical protein